MPMPLPRLTAVRHDGNEIEYDLSGLRPLRDAFPTRPPEKGTFLRAAINTAHTDGKGYGWLNTLTPGGFWRRSYETRPMRGQMVRTCAHARDLCLRQAVENARFGGYTRLIVEHES